MSHENVELVKRFIAPAATDYRVCSATTSFGPPPKKPASPLSRPTSKVLSSPGGSDKQFTGLDGLREAFLNWIAPWTSYYDEIGEVFAVGDDRVVVLGREHGYRRDTEAEVEAESAGVYFLRDGKIARIEYYANRAEALEAVGLARRDSQKSS